jgi:hypothetical protein
MAVAVIIIELDWVSHVHLFSVAEFWMYVGYFNEVGDEDIN